MQLISQIKAARDPTDADVQLCRLGLSNDDSVSNSLASIQNSFVNAYLSTLGSNRRKRGDSLLKLKHST